ncbi:MAG: hypothetical protein HY279_14250 [Nitrospinae bacterium]|nr:hypothetical protein [Nitrospinota bacterium]
MKGIKSSMNRDLFGLIILIVLLISSEILEAAEERKILIINSDRTVTNYKIAHEEFKTGIGYPVMEIDLGKDSESEKNLTEIISKSKPDVIYCIGSRAYLFANKAAGKGNFIFTSIINWQRLPLTDKTFGIANELPPLMHLTLYRHIFPKITDIGIIYSNRYNREWVEDAVKSAKEVGINIIARQIENKDGLDDALQYIVPKAQAIWLIPDPAVISDRDSLMKIFDKSRKFKKPVYSYSDVYIDLGAAISISTDIQTMARQAAGLSRDILIGADIPERIQHPAGSYIILNMKNVMEYGVEINMDALESVNKIIR